MSRVDCPWPFQLAYRMSRDKLFVIHFDHPEDGDVPAAGNNVIAERGVELYGLYWDNEKGKWALVCHR